jgi:hypothetical protein
MGLNQPVPHLEGPEPTFLLFWSQDLIHLSQNLDKVFCLYCLLGLCSGVIGEHSSTLGRQVYYHRELITQSG